MISILFVSLKSGSGSAYGFSSSSSSCNEVFEQHQNRDKTDLVGEDGKPNLVYRKYKYFKDERR